MFIYNAPPEDIALLLLKVQEFISELFISVVRLFKNKTPPSLAWLLLKLLFLKIKILSEIKTTPPNSAELFFA